MSAPSAAGLVPISMALPGHALDHHAHAHAHAHPYLMDMRARQMRPDGWMMEDQLRALYPSAAAYPSVSDATNRNKLKHNLSEVHRRARLADKFEILRQVSLCTKKDRFSILQSAISRLKEYEGMLKRGELKKESKSEPAPAPAPQPAAPVHDAEDGDAHIDGDSDDYLDDSAIGGDAGFPSLSLSNNFLLSAVPTALISESGSLIDVNKSFCEFFQYPARKFALSSSLASLCADSASTVTSVVSSLLSGSCDRSVIDQRVQTHRGEVKEISLMLWSLKRVGKVPVLTAVFMPKCSNNEAQKTETGAASNATPAPQTKPPQTQAPSQAYMASIPASAAGYEPYRVALPQIAFQPPQSSMYNSLKPHELQMMNQLASQRAGFAMGMAHGQHQYAMPGSAKLTSPAGLTGAMLFNPMSPYLFPPGTLINPTAMQAPSSAAASTAVSSAPSSVGTPTSSLTPPQSSTPSQSSSQGSMN